MANTLRPVVDPALPPDDRLLLLEAADSLRPAGDEPPAPPSWGGRTRLDVLMTMLIATVCGFFPLAVGPFLQGAAGLAVGAAAQLGLVAAWWSGGFTLFLITGTVLQLISWGALLVFVGGEGEHAELARKHHGRYYLEADFASGKKVNRWFGLSPRKLMERTQTAIATVLDSEVNSAGLLDDTANAVALPQQEWEIAQALAELSRVRRQLVDIVRAEQTSVQVQRAMEPQRQALKTSADALARRVEALERYADRTRAADAAYREWRTLQELEELSDDTLDVLSRTARDELAVAEIDGLAGRSGLEPLRDSLREAREAAQVLAPPVEEVRA
ncbi:hypothetical protein [Actinomadura hibisca]|uniref:hypothetical protein n=1 Tax=Actinomadura hibisca TaxID=68565 RepID=UPI00083755CF|nr:hypothetical protein [Actinomadura hibisca]